MLVFLLMFEPLSSEGLIYSKQEKKGELNRLDRI